MKRVTISGGLALALWLLAPTAQAASISGSGMPPVGSEGDCILTQSGVWASGACPGAGTGAPTGASYIQRTPDATNTNETALSTLATGCVASTTTTGAVATRSITGTANQITVTNGDCSANPTISIPTNPTLPGTTTGTFSGPLTGNVTGNADTATALAADPVDCSAGSATTGINATGTAQGCTNYQEEPASNGLVARTAANTSAARTLTGTANQITITNGDGVSGNPTAALSSTLVIPGAQIDFTEATGDGTCAAGDFWVRANSTTNTFRKCQNGAVTDLDTGGGGSITGTVGTTDNAVVRADGTGGSTAQGSLVTIDDTGKVTAPGGFESTGGTGIWSLLEGTPPGCGASAGLHNIYFDSGDSKLKSCENGGSVVTYVRTADTLAALNASTSADLAGVLSDEIGTSGGFVRGTGATLTDLTVAGNPVVFPDGVRQTFNPNATNAGLNVGAHTADASAPQDGDIIYNTTSGKFRAREGGTWKDLISSGAGTGDVTDVNAGAGIAVTSPGGPAPTVAWDASTFVGNVTLWDGANVSRTLTASLSGVQDPVITFSNNLINITTGSLQVGSADVVTATSSNTLTGKSLDCEASGNTCTIARRIWLPAAGCNGATAGPIWDLPASSPAVAACVTGTNTQKGVLDFADGSNLSAQVTYKLPSTWVGNIDANIKWFSATTTGDVVWQLATVCVADAETDDPAFNTASTVTDATKGTTNQTNDASITTVTATGCAAGELLHLKLSRDSGHASDTMAGTARLIGVELITREAI